MKTKFTLFVCLVICMGGFSLNALSNDLESDKKNYWILEDFDHFPIEEEWNILKKNYKTYPNDIDLTTVYANVEQGFDCAYGHNAMRIRGLEEGGSAEFTVPNASRVTIRITGKQKAADRGVIIYRNGKEVFREEGFDRYECIEFSEAINSQVPVTYKLTAADETKRDPMVLYYIEVQKYGVSIDPPQPPQPNYDQFWIYEEFSEMNVEEDYNTHAIYKTIPNQIELTGDSINIELGEGCSGGAGRKNLRIRGKQFDGGKVEFTVPDAKTVTIDVTGKSTYADRIVKIYKDDQLVKTFENMDRNTCERYTADVNSDKSVKYRIEGGDNTDKPVGITKIYVEKLNYTSIGKVGESPIVHIYPNPAIETVFFNEEIEIASVFELNGKLVAKEMNTSQMDISTLKAGIYIIKLTTSKGVITQKLIKK